MPLCEQNLDKLCRGETVVITGVRKFAEIKAWRPRYCPCCAAEEQQGLGEAYWHVDHQIPLMSHCPTHGCRLISLEELPMGQLDYTFFPLSGFDLSPPNPHPDDAPEWQISLSKILHDYWAFPHEASATEGDSNLAITLSNMGYGSQQKASQHMILNAKRVFADMVNFYGAGMMEQMFGGEKGLPIINRACKWAVATPERYALLQCVAGLDTATMFSSVRVEDRQEAQLRQLQRSGMIFTKEQVMEQMGATASQLEIMARRYRIMPFWKRSGGEGERMHKLSLVLDTKEYEIYKVAFQRSGYRFDRHFLKHCILEYISENRGGRSI